MTPSYPGDEEEISSLSSPEINPTHLPVIPEEEIEFSRASDVNEPSDTPHSSDASERSSEVINSEIMKIVRKVRGNDTSPFPSEYPERRFSPRLNPHREISVNHPNPTPSSAPLRKRNKWRILRDRKLKYKTRKKQ